MLPLALRANVPTVHGLEFAYSLYPLPPGRLPFKRWRWELWHGTHLIAAGWRFSRPDAGRALRLYAAEHGHKLFGLTAPPRDERAARGDLPPGHDRAHRDRLDHGDARPARTGASARRALGAAWPCARPRESLRPRWMSEPPMIEISLM